MKIFVSYASEQTSDAEAIGVALANDGHDVFVSKAALDPGKEFHSRIREEIESSDLIVFLLSQALLTPGRYTQTELALAQRRWPAPSGHVLPVVVDDIATSTIDPYLRSLTVLRPAGSVAAEVSAAVARLGHPRAERAEELLQLDRYPEAEQVLSQIIDQDPTDGLANLLSAYAALAGHNPRTITAAKARQVEQYLRAAALEEETGDDALRMLAIVRYDYYILGGLREPPPVFGDILAKLPTPTERPPRLLLAQLVCSETAHDLVLGDWPSIDALPIAQEGRT